MMNEQRAKVFDDRYAMKGPDGQPVETTPEEMFTRVADAIGDNPLERADFNRLLDDFKFVPGGRILAGAGVDAEVTFYNCYVIPVETKARRHLNYVGMEEAAYGPSDSGNDSREAIFDTIGLMVDIMSRGGGVGINWSVLRPSGAYLKRVNGTSSGPVGWMNVASTAVGEVEQGGSRRGAAMFMLDDWHPDLLRFINAKRDNALITNANVSVAISDEFMAAVREDGDWVLRFPATDDPEYNSSWDGDLAGWQARGGRVVDYATVPARELWGELTAAAHASGEPGVVFLGRYNAQSTGAGVERLISVNPCGEQGLGAYSVCNLGAMNLDAYIVERETTRTRGSGKYAIRETTVREADTTTGRSFDYERFADDVGTAVRFLDNVIDKNYYFLPENEAIQKRLRRIGLSVMGLADALIGLGLRYGSQGAVEFTEAVFRVMKDAAIRASIDLAREKGAAPAWDDSMWDRPYLAEYKERHGLSAPMLPLRNLFLLTQAPTGTTSILAGVNSGIEPLFDLSYVRTDRTGTHTVHAPAIEKYKPQDIPTVANDVSVEEHIAMQAAVQKYVDSSVSKTINAPNGQSVEDTAKAYQLAYDSGLKGLAYYRDGSRQEQVLNHAKDEKTESAGWSEADGASYHYLYEDALQVVADLREDLAKGAEFVRPTILKGETLKTRTTAGTAYVTVNRDDEGNAREVFFSVGKAGSDITGLAEAMGRLASLALRKGATLGGVANQLEGVGGSSQLQKPVAHSLGLALSDINRASLSAGSGEPAMARVLGVPMFARDLKDFSVSVSPNVAVPPVAEQARSRNADLCPECGSVALVREEGCAKCRACGFSQC